MKGIQVARGAPQITHMFFADDTYIFRKAKETEADHVLDVLKIFESSFGQKINASKTSIFFSRNTDQGVREVLCNMLNFREADAGTKYLGLPNMLGRKKSAALGYLKIVCVKEFKDGRKRICQKESKRF